jgi:hypothetical protein
MSDKDEQRTGFHFYFRSVAPLRTPWGERVFMLVVTFLLMVALPAAIAGIFFGIARLGAAWGGGH